jgi:branched-chain amino acid transport system permease protein
VAETAAVVSPAATEPPPGTSRVPRGVRIGLTIAACAAAIIVPLFIDSGGNVMNNLVLAAAYIVMALGLNIIVGFAGLLDLGYVAFFAIGAYTMGYFGSGFHANAGGGEGLHILVTGPAQNLPGIHVNFLIICVIAVAATTVAGMVIGLPTLRLRGDYIAIVTLAFGEIVGRIAINGDEITGFGTKLTAGRQGITPVDKIDLPGVERFTSLELRPWFYVALALVFIVLFVNFRLRDSRLGRAWIALREDEVAAASMGVPLVKTKLLSYAAGGAFGGISGAFLGPVYASVNANQFQFGFSIFILAMVILGGLGSIWGVVLGAIALGFINHWFIPDVLDGEFVRERLDSFGLNFSFSEVSFGVFGFLLLLMMVLRPEGLIPERRHKLELAEAAGAVDESIYEARV